MREKKDQAIGNSFINRFEEALQKLSSGLHKKGGLKKYDKVMEKVGSLRQKYSKVSRQFKISVKKDEKSNNANQIT